MGSEGLAKSRFLHALWIGTANPQLGRNGRVEVWIGRISSALSSSILPELPFRVKIQLAIAAFIE
jgi:hypothetical protein